MNPTRRAPSSDVIEIQIKIYNEEHGKLPSARFLRAANGNYGSLSTYSSELARWKSNSRMEITGQRPEHDNREVTGTEKIDQGVGNEAIAQSATRSSACSSSTRKRGRPRKIGIARGRSFENLFAEMIALEEGPENTSNNRDADVGSKTNSNGNELNIDLLNYIAANAVGVVDFDEHGDEDLAPLIPALVEDEREEREAIERQQRKDAAWAARRKSAATAAPPPGGSFSYENLLEELLVHHAGWTGANGAASSAGVTAPTAPGTSANAGANDEDGI